MLHNIYMQFPYVLSELTKEDLQAIRTIVKEEIAESEARTDLKLQLLTTRIDEMDKRLTASMTAMDKRVGFLQVLVVTLIAAIIGVPTIIFIYLERRTFKGNKESQRESSSSLSQEILASLRGR